MSNPTLKTTELSSQSLFVGDVEFCVAPLGGHSRPDTLVIVKPIEAVHAYRALMSSLDSPFIVELGIAYGGSVGLLALEAQPARMVAIEKDPNRVELLDDFLEEHGLDSRVSLHYGVDQADRVRLASIVDEEFRDSRIDVVIDDASHMYGQTVATFETLFPLLRPGGRYIIEDWNCDHAIRSMLAAAYRDKESPYHDWATAAVRGELSARNEGQDPLTAVAVSALKREDGLTSRASLPLSRLAAELVLGVAEPDNGIAAVSTNQFWLEVERDAQPLGSDFALGSACRDHFGTLSTDL